MANTNNTNTLSLAGPTCSASVFHQNVQRGLPSHLYQTLGKVKKSVALYRGLHRICIWGLNATERAIGISVLKGDFMTKEVQQLLDASDKAINAKWEIRNTFHHGGYAKHRPELIDFMNTGSLTSDNPHLETPNTASRI